MIISKQDLVGDEIRAKISEIGKLWHQSQNNPRIDNDVLKKWDNLINEWINDETMPLIVRKETNKRGHVVNHPSGRKIIFSDNTVAIWVYSNVINGKVFKLSEIRELLNHDELPIVFIASRETLMAAEYTKQLGKNPLQDWKLCHITPIGFNTRKSITDIDMTLIINHFRNYLSPKNMFILPKEIGYLGEIDEFISEQKVTG